MKRCLILVLLLLIPGFAFANGRPEAVPMPKTFWVEPQTGEYPLWIDASEMLTADGKLREDLFHPHARFLIEEALKTPASDGCIHLTEYYESIVNTPDRTSLAKAARTSELILLGTVTARSFGFEGYTPGQLLRIRRDEVLKGEREALSEYYVFVPVGEFTIGEKKICKTDKRYAEPPQIGDQVLLFVPEHFRRDDAYLTILDEHGLVTLKQTGEASLPRRLRGEAANREQVLARVRGALREVR